MNTEDIEVKNYSYEYNGEKFNFQMYPGEGNMVYAQALGEHQLCSIRVVRFPSNNLEIHIKDLRSKTRRQNRHHILISRSIDKAFRPSGIRERIIITIISRCKNYDITRISHFASSVLLSGSVRVGFAKIDGYQMSAKSNGILSMELTQEPSWACKRNITKAYKECLNFMTIFDKEKKTSPFKTDAASLLVDSATIDSIINQEESYDRKSISAYLASNKKRFDRNRQGFRNIKIITGPNRVDFIRGKTHVSSQAIEESGCGLVSSYDFFGGSMRRNVGHGSLVSRTIATVASDTIDLMITSDVIRANGSTSMAATCGQSLLLATLGLISKADLVSALSFGLFRGKDCFHVIVDMTALEDEYSEVDCKVTATSKGIICIQLDSKSHITLEELFFMLDQAKIYLGHLRQLMVPFIPGDLQLIVVEKKKIGLLVGKGGKTIRRIRDVSGVDSMRLYGDHLVLGSKNRKDARLMIDPIIGNPGKKALLEIKSISPLAVIGGLVKNSGKFNKFKLGDIVEANIIDWKRENRNIEIIGIRV